MKCLVETRHDPSRRERYDLWPHALFTVRDNNPSHQSIIPYRTGRYSGLHIPGISCLATLIWSLRDNSDAQGVSCAMEIRP